MAKRKSKQPTASEAEQNAARCLLIALAEEVARRRNDGHLLLGRTNEGWFALLPVSGSLPTDVPAHARWEDALGDLVRRTLRPHDK